MSNVTDAICHYDGIFKFIHTECAKEHFLQAREKLNSGDFNTAISLFRKCKDLCELDEDKDTIDLILRELDRLMTSRIPEGTIAADDVGWCHVRRRDLKKLEERSDALPQGIFFLNMEDGESGSPVRLVGRKLVSDKWISNKIPELFCSTVAADMILGLYTDLRVTEDMYMLWYHPLTVSEKLTVFKHIVESDGKRVELVFPFPLLKKDTKREFGSPEEGWQIDDAYDVMLSHGEDDIRHFTVEYLSNLKLKNPIFYDPACSTGVFLAAMKSSFPGAYTIGQDLSRQMAEVSRARVDEVHCGNAMKPKIDSGTADVVFVRFLNSEVVRSQEADDLFMAILPTVRKGGNIIIVGHTPVLLSSSNMAACPGFELQKCIGVTQNRCGIFQFYVLKRCSYSKMIIV